MSELQNKNKYDRDVPVKLKLYLCLFSEDEEFIHFVKQAVDRNLYSIKVIALANTLIKIVQERQAKIDCLLLTDTPSSHDLIRQLKQQGIFLPVAIACVQDFIQDKVLYHPAEVKFNFDEVNLSPIINKQDTTNSQTISDRINLALTQFLNLDENKCLAETRQKPVDTIQHHSLTQQQQRLAQKLKERLGYLGVYYKRNPQDFYRNLNNSQKEQLNRQLASEYRKIILGYFENEPKINQIIDRFINTAFLSNISVSQVLEIHMELMNEFSQHLKLAGRSEDILLDYRLALIDIIAHLCEMYRRSIPSEDIALDVLFEVD